MSQLFKMTQTMRWYGPEDPVSLSDIRQAGCSGVVTALHHLPNGAVWSIGEIQKRKDLIENAGLVWSVVESLPVHESIKTQAPDYLRFIHSYKQSLRNLSACGINTVTYNFMPVLDWTRTDLNYSVPSGAKTLRFEKTALIAFDLFILQRVGAAHNYSKEEIHAAETRFSAMTRIEKEQLERNVIAGLPGCEEHFNAKTLSHALKAYEGINGNRLRQNLIEFLTDIIPVAEHEGLLMAIHPDDPPYSLLGLPRVVSTTEDLAAIVEAVPSIHNGLCFCTGSFGVCPDNDLVAILKQFGERVHFLHLRNTKRNEAGDFFEDNHLDGDTDMCAVVEEIVKIMQEHRVSIPMRPDHGQQMLNDLTKKINPGYSAIGRLKGLAELRGLELGLLTSYSKNLSDKKHETLEA